MDKLEFKTDGRVLGEASLDVDPKLKVIDYFLLFFRIFEDLEVDITHSTAHSVPECLLPNLHTST